MSATAVVEKLEAKIEDVDDELVDIMEMIKKDNARLKKAGTDLDKERICDRLGSYQDTFNKLINQRRGLEVRLKKKIAEARTESEDEEESETEDIEEPPAPRRSKSRYVPPQKRIHVPPPSPPKAAPTVASAAAIADPPRVGPTVRWW